MSHLNDAYTPTYFENVDQLPTIVTKGQVSIIRSTVVQLPAWWAASSAAYASWSLSQ